MSARRRGKFITAVDRIDTWHCKVLLLRILLRTLSHISFQFSKHWPTYLAPCCIINTQRRLYLRFYTVVEINDIPKKYRDFRWFLKYSNLHFTGKRKLHNPNWNLVTNTQIGPGDKILFSEVWRSTFRYQLNKYIWPWRSCQLGMRHWVSAIV